MEFINQIEPWYGQEEKKAVADYLNSGGWLMEFKKTQEFEGMIAKFVGAKYCSVVSNGTASLFIALNALGIGQGDEVIVPDETISATPNAVILAGAKPVFVDIDKESLCINPDLIKKAITRKTKAVIHVSLNGRAGRLKKIRRLCKERNIYLIEDAAQSLGSFYGGKHLGTWGEIGCFSFSMPKIITTGQGGALITNSKKLYQKFLRIKNFGRRRGGEDWYVSLGWNFKFTDIQAVIGIEQMKKLPWRIKRKKEIYKLYKNLLEVIPEVKFIDTDLNNVSPCFVDILVPGREALFGYLKEHNIGFRPIFPALHSQPAYLSYNKASQKKDKFPVAQKIAKEGLWLPSSSKLSDSQIKYICGKIKKFYA